MTSYANGNPPDQVRAQIPLSLDLNTFQATDFNVATIVSGLTDHLVAQSKLDGGGECPSSHPRCSRYFGVGDNGCNHLAQAVDDCLKLPSPYSLRPFALHINVGDSR